MSVRIVAELFYKSGEHLMFLAMTNVLCKHATLWKRVIREHENGSEYSTEIVRTVLLQPLYS